MNLETFKNTVLPTKHKMYRVALRITGNPVEAEDVVQEVFIKVWENRSTLENVDNLPAWCMQMTKNKAIDKIRLKANQTEGIDGLYSMSSPDTTPDRKAELQDAMQHVTRLMNQLPEAQRMAMQLRDIEGMSYQEISKVLDQSLSQVKTNIFRARKGIKKEITAVMGNQLVESLLNKYFEGTTDVAEEKQLKQYFQQDDIPAHLLPYQPLFNYFDEAVEETLDEGFDARLLAQLEEDKPTAVVRKLSVYSWVVRVAAVALLTLGGWWLASDYVTTPPQTAGIDWSKYEVQDPEKAFQYTQMALLKASEELNRGASTAAKEVSNLGKIGKYLNE